MDVAGSMNGPWMRVGMDLRCGRTLFYVFIFISLPIEKQQQQNKKRVADHHQQQQKMEKQILTMVYLLDKDKQNTDHTVLVR